MVLLNEPGAHHQRSRLITRRGPRAALLAGGGAFLGAGMLIAEHLHALLGFCIGAMGVIALLVWGYVALTNPRRDSPLASEEDKNPC